MPSQSSGPGVKPFNLLSVAKDPDLKEQIDPDMAQALRDAGYNPQAELGILNKYKSPHGGLSHIVVSSYNVSCQSARGRINPSGDYVGMVLYAKDGKTD